MIDQTKIDELKKAYTSGIYEGEISFTDDEDAQRTVLFIYRKPTTADLESYAKQGEKSSPLIANLNLLQSLIVCPEPGPIIDQIRDYPVAYGRFVEKAMAPFFGLDAEVKIKKL